MLELQGLSITWQGIALVEEASFTVCPGDVVVLNGANGTGKSSLIAAIAGLAPADRGRVIWDGRDVTHVPLHDRDGIALVPEGRLLAPSLTVMETLRLGAGRIGRGALLARTQEAFARFPILAERRHQAAGTLSGGEAQMLNLARALMAAPRLLLLDEPTLGLSPAAAKAMFRMLGTLRSEGMSMVLTDQDSLAASSLADRVLALSDRRLEPVADMPRTATA